MPKKHSKKEGNRRRQDQPDYRRDEDRFKPIKKRRRVNRIPEFDNPDDYLDIDLEED